MIFGFHAVTARLRHDASTVEEIYVDASRHDRRMGDLLRAAKAANVRIIQADDQRLDAMVGTRRHQGVVARAGELSLARNLAELLDGIQGPPLLLLLDGVTDPHNLGACLRSADACGALAVIIPKDRAAQMNATVRKVAAGAAETTPLVVVTNLARCLRDLKEAGLWVVGADAGAAQRADQVELHGPVVLVLGAEGSGLRQLTRSHCDFIVSLPAQGAVESLNVSVAAGMLLYEAVRQRVSR